jgi:phosphate transport system permease protein
MLRKKIVNYVMLSLTGVCAVGVVSILFIILGYLAWHGASSLSWNFFTKLPAPAGESGGGMANAIVGTGKLLLLATLIGVPIGFMGGLHLAEFGGTTFNFAVRYATDLLNGVPSIVIGIFAYALVVVPMGHASTLAGGIALGIMMIPIALRTTEEFLRSVPQPLREGALALGFTKWQTVKRVIIPTALQGIISGMMLDLARVAGETAPLLFTAGESSWWSPGWNRQTASLPVMIFRYSTGAFPDWVRMAWAAGFLLLMLVLALNIIARVMVSGRSHVGR